MVLHTKPVSVEDTGSLEQSSLLLRRRAVIRSRHCLLMNSGRRGEESSNCINVLHSCLFPACPGQCSRIKCNWQGIACWGPIHYQPRCSSNPLRVKLGSWREDLLIVVSQ